MGLQQPFNIVEPKNTEKFISDEKKKYSVSSRVLGEHKLMAWNTSEFYANINKLEWLEDFKKCRWYGPYAGTLKDLYMCSAMNPELKIPCMNMSWSIQMVSSQIVNLVRIEWFKDADYAA